MISAFAPLSAMTKARSSAVKRVLIGTATAPMRMMPRKAATKTGLSFSSKSARSPFPRIGSQRVPEPVHLGIELVEGYCLIAEQDRDVAAPAACERRAQEFRPKH